MIREAIQNILEAGEAAGKLEIVKTDVKKARAFAEQAMKDSDRDLDKELPGFDANYEKAKKLANLGKTQRKDMPVIEIEDVQAMQKKLAQGAIDVAKPYSDDTKNNNNDPYPSGLSGKEAEAWMKDGLKPFDGDAKDDIVKAKMGKKSMGELKPIQKQIYFDKSLAATAEFGAKGTTAFLTTNSIMVVSADNYIIDGHHRWLSGNLIDSKMKVPALIIDLPIEDLLPLSLAYGDALGNERNK